MPNIYYIILITLTVHGGCIQGSPSICMGRGLMVLHRGRRDNEIEQGSTVYTVCELYVRCVYVDSRLHREG